MKQNLIILVNVRYRIILTLVILLSSFSLYAQSYILKGTVLDNMKEPLPGANVQIKGTTEGALTDLDGNFELSVSPEQTLIVSFIGYKPQEILIKGQKQLQVILNEDTQMLDETVVVGYGTMKKSDLTGAISSVDVGELSKRATTNPAEALQGKIAGVNIQKSGGNAGAGVRVKIRGVKTFGSNEPLYIIDGFPGSITSVNPSDIESMEVLKDGAAAAIYGSVAANGVIIVTTKKGKKGDIKVDFSTYLSFSSVDKKLDMLDANGYVQVHKQMYENYNNDMPANSQEAIPEYITNPGDINTDWQKAMFRNSFSQNYMVGVRGGSESARFALSYNHADDEGTIVGNDYKLDNVRMKVDFSKYIFDVDANVGIKGTSNNQPKFQLKEMYMISPLVPVYDENNKYGFGLTNFKGIPNNRNVVADDHFRSRTNKTKEYNANISVNVNITDWLKFRTSYSFRGANNLSTSHNPDYIADVKAPNEYPYYSEYSSYWQEQVFNNVLTFDKQIKKNSINAMVGAEITRENMQWHEVGVEGKKTEYSVSDGKLVTTIKPGGFLDPYFQTINAGIGGTFGGSGSKYEYNRASFFGRVNYSYDSKYLFQATLRYDGSSKFGSDSRWGFFPSVALGWRITEESFFPETDIVSNLKLRGSWGRLGNEGALGYYDFLALIKTYNSLYMGYVQGSGENPWPGSIAPGLENRNLKWETTDTKNIGLDYGFLSNRLYGSINYYYNKTEDLLITKKMPPSAGLWDPTLNVGKIKNSGIEFEVNWVDRINSFEYNVGFNLTTVNNKVLSLSSDDQILYGEGLKYGSEHFPTQTRVGRPIGAFYLYKSDGLFQTMDEVNAHKGEKGILQPNAKPGDMRFVDVNGDGEINTDDQVFCGTGIPKVEANLNLGLSYKGFDFSVVFGSAWGHKIYNGNRYFYEGMASGTNFLKSTLNAWTPENRNTNVPRAVLQDKNGNARESDRFLENGNFIRMRQIQLGYSLPSVVLKKAWIESLRFYVSGENLWTWTNYSGVDPEFSRASVLNSGIDNLIYPFNRTYVVGLQLVF